MRVRAHDRRDASVEVVGERDLLACRLGMEVHEHGHVLGHLVERGVGRAERAVHRVHEHAAEEVQHGEAADGRGDERPALPRRAGRVVGGAHGVRELADGGGELLLPPRVVAERDRVRARREDLVGERHGDAAAGGRVLGVDDHGRHAELAPDAGQLLLQDPAAGASHHVADHQHLHAETSGDAVQSATSGAPRFSKQLIGVTVKRNARPGSSSRANTQYDGAVAFLCAEEWL